MKKKHIVVLVAMMICLLSLAGSGIFVANVLNAKKEADAEKEANKISYDTFAAWTDVETFQDVPVMTGKKLSIGKVVDYGKKDYILHVDNTSVEEYKAYLDVLADAGFTKHSDNGEDAMEGYAYTAAFTKDKITVVVSHLIREGKTYISATKRALSDRMIYKEEYVQGIDPNAKNSLHLVELGNNGASLVVKLKNGHFVIHDGGNGFDAPYLLDYLESLTPGDEKPIVEGWFISHPHGDHYGALQAIGQNIGYANRIIVDGVYFHYPQEQMIKSETNIYSTLCDMLGVSVKGQDGQVAKNYRPQLGQRYYFCDITVDVSLTMEQVAVETYQSSDVNDTSSWFKMHIDGQTVLLGGDSSLIGTRTMMSLYEPSYYAVDIFAVLHHGMNVYQYFVDSMEVKTLLYPCFRAGSLYSNKYPNFAREDENESMRTKAEEFYSHGEGTVVMTFPYKVGTAKIMEPCKWQYSGGMPPERTTTEWGWEWDGLRYYYNP